MGGSPRSARRKARSRVSISAMPMAPTASRTPSKPAGMSRAAASGGTARVRVSQVLSPPPSMVTRKPPWSGTMAVTDWPVRTSSRSWPAIAAGIAESPWAKVKALIMSLRRGLRLNRASAG